MLFDPFEKIAILGPGAVGGLLAAVLWKNKCQVTCIGREESTRTIQKDGIFLKSEIFGNFLARPQAQTELDFSPDVLLIATKAYDLEAALNRIPEVFLHKTLIIPFLNGLDHMEIIRKYLNSKMVIAGSISVESYRSTANEIINTSTPAIRLATDASETKERASQLARWLSTLGLECEVDESEAKVLWGKLVLLNALALSTTASGKSVGELLSDPFWRQEIKNCVAEAASVAEKFGVAIRIEQVWERAESLRPELFTSMSRDRQNGRPLELEAIIGSILKRAEIYDIPCPSIKKLYEQIKESIA